ncbi:heme-binding protein [Rhizobiales bacterium RZME27]|uniref:Heme-binding protein n=1 Tax=Endobacterium cereale TaxID=2663029 RepID=A0A6A8A9V3_9HYPH|nr:heme-binding protein [Endobacterium cereale]MEB2847998.1 heme-binding protein [Endobacterium cereale]MQY46667.1 heme-binding protein [Endobacterium cereale]
MKTLLIALAASALVTAPSFAKDTVQQTSLATTLAVDIAQAAVSACTGDGYNVSAAVTDRSGVLLALVRSENAGAHTANASTQKAFTSASSRNPTSAMADNVAKNPGAAGLADIPGFLVLAGGVPIKVGKDTIGAIGVAGAPGGNLDEVCANKAIENVGTRLQ